MNNKLSVLIFFIMFFSGNQEVRGSMYSTIKFFENMPFVKKLVNVFIHLPDFDFSQGDESLSIINDDEVNTGIIETITDVAKTVVDNIPSQEMVKKTSSRVGTLLWEHKWKTVTISSFTVCIAYYRYQMNKNKRLEKETETKSKHIGGGAYATRDNVAKKEKDIKKNNENLDEFKDKIDKITETIKDTTQETIGLNTKIDYIEKAQERILSLLQSSPGTEKPA